jgi:hypothetical protein
MSLFVAEVVVEVVALPFVAVADVGGGEEKRSVISADLAR